MSKGETRIEEPSPAERAVIRRAAESRATVPVLELSLASPASGDALPTEVVVKACALALREHPRANASYRDGQFELHSQVNVGVLVATERAYVIPTVLDADGKGLPELSAEIADLREQAEAGRLASPALSGATFTVWNASADGLAAASIPVVPPQAGALTAGLRDLVLACDHRILYGHRATSFLKAVAHHLDGQRI
ncbi:MAG TPA: 2-oxo acid dehydrogenase subunit E2 [Solirubrobacteraceae bacterium]|nr:2-oxo acid dehydrogenase subunit E2 [Solirubrobacteraceae bacterium]